MLPLPLLIPLIAFPWHRQDARWPYPGNKGNQTLTISKGQVKNVLPGLLICPQLLLEDQAAITTKATCSQLGSPEGLVPHKGWPSEISTWAFSALKQVYIKCFRADLGEPGSPHDKQYKPVPFRLPNDSRCWFYQSLSLPSHLSISWQHNYWGFSWVNELSIVSMKKAKHCPFESLTFEIYIYSVPYEPEANKPSRHSWPLGTLRPNVDLHYCPKTD